MVSCSSENSGLSQPILVPLTISRAGIRMTLGSQDGLVLTIVTRPGLCMVPWKFYGLRRGLLFPAGIESEWPLFRLATIISQGLQVGREVMVGRTEC